MEFKTTHDSVIFRFSTQEEREILYGAVAKTLIKAASSQDYITIEDAHIAVHTLPLKWNVPIALSKASSLLVFARCLESTRPDLGIESLPLSHSMEAQFKTAAQDLNNENIVYDLVKLLENARAEDFG